MSAPYPWSSLPRVDPRATRWIAAAQAWLACAGAGSVILGGERRGDLLDLGITGATVTGIGGRARVDDPTAYAVRVRKGALEAHVVAPGRLIRAIAQRLLGGPDELDAPRPLTRIERAVLPVAVAAVLDRLDAQEVEVDDELLSGARAPDSGVIVEVAVAGPVPATVAIVLPERLPVPPRRSLGEIARARAGWLDGARAPLVIVAGWARLDPRSFSELKRRDVIVPTWISAAHVDLLAARGRFSAALARPTGRITVLSAYRRGTMDETLGDDATIDVAIALGEVRLSVRSLLELRPGQVLELGRPVGSEVELRIGPKVIGRGELVDVGGEVGVRVLTIDSTSP